MKYKTEAPLERSPTKCKCHNFDMAKSLAARKQHEIYRKRGGTLVRCGKNENKKVNYSSFRKRWQMPTFPNKIISSSPLPDTINQFQTNNPLSSKYWKVESGGYMPLTPSSWEVRHSSEWQWHCNTLCSHLFLPLNQHRLHGRITSHSRNSLLECKSMCPIFWKTWALPEKLAASHLT